MFVFQLLVLLSFLVSPANTAEEVIQAGIVYESGTRLHSPWSGVSFDVPDGFVAQYDEAMAGVIMQQTGSSVLLGVWGVSEGSIEELGEAVVAAIEEQEVLLVPEVQEQPDDRTLFARFQAISGQGIATLQGLVRGGDYGNAIAIAALGAPEESDRLNSVIHSMMDGVSWNEPEAAAWKTILAGKAFSGSSSGSDYSDGIGADDYASSASQSSRLFAFCDSEWYVYKMESQLFFSTGAGSVSSEGGEAHQGKWWLVADLAGEAFLILESNEGLVYEWDIEETENGMLLDGASYALDQQAGCY